MSEGELISRWDQFSLPRVTLRQIHKTQRGGTEGGQTETAQTLRRRASDTFKLSLITTSLCPSHLPLQTVEQDNLNKLS